MLTRDQLTQVETASNTPRGKRATYAQRAAEPSKADHVRIVDDATRTTYEIDLVDADGVPRTAADIVAIARSLLASMD